MKMIVCAMNFGHVTPNWLKSCSRICMVRGFAEADRPARRRDGPDNG
jgi:hypothetical protein